MSEWFGALAKKPGERGLTLAERVYNRVFRAVHGIGENADSLLKATFKALRRVSLDPSRSPKPAPS